ncbi:MAG TPA: hypothetical protein VK177_09660 [Flavobacteriales bacterium]|nr:hypothetical protein [Flavobacteriales bacterium]
MSRCKTVHGLTQKGEPKNAPACTPMHGYASLQPPATAHITKTDPFQTLPVWQ